METLQFRACSLSTQNDLETLILVKSPRSGESFWLWETWKKQCGVRHELAKVEPEFGSVLRRGRLYTPWEVNQWNSWVEAYPLVFRLLIPPRCETIQADDPEVQCFF